MCILRTVTGLVTFPSLIYSHARQNLSELPINHHALMPVRFEQMIELVKRGEFSHPLTRTHTILLLWFIQACIGICLVGVMHQEDSKFSCHKVIESIAWSHGVL